MSRSIARARLRPVAASILLAAGAMLTGCGAPHAGRSAAVGPCAQVLPLAFATVHHHGRLTVAKVLSDSALRDLLAVAPRFSGTTIGRGPHHPKSCLIVYRDSYRSHEVGTRARAGSYAILLVRVRHPLLIAAFVRDRLPPAATP